VHLVRRIADNKRMALKRVNLDMEYAHKDQSLNNEIQVLKKLDNPFVV
jgi:serine/threonine protein kinase